MSHKQIADTSEQAIWQAYFETLLTPDNFEKRMIEICLQKGVRAASLSTVYRRFKYGPKKWR